MAGMQFEYDEKGGTFYYFLLSFMALVLIPGTYYLWPRKDEKDETDKNKKVCKCEPCLSKNQHLKATQPWKKMKIRGLKLGLIIGWLLFVLVAYKASQVELDFKEFDPYAELGIDQDATTAEIKKAYRKLSLIHHPDRETGNHKIFMKITKAYKALTDEEARENWKNYGNPDGPGATNFGIALPAWIVEKQNSVWVLAAYGLVFMVILPLVVGTWWYRSIKYSAEQILMDTTQLYFYFFHKTPNMMLRRVIMILAGSMEFEKTHNGEIVERPSDNEEIPALMRDLPQLHEKNKERPLCYPYSVKARALLHAHFSRLDLPPKSLEIDRQYILKKCPYLINEMINIVAQLVAMAHAGRVSRMPRLETLENCMKISQMIIQALWDNKSPLRQLPHISEDMLRHFTTKRRNIRSIPQFVRMKEEDRRSLLRGLSDAEYRDVLSVCAKMPSVEMNIRSEVLDDDDKTITAGSIVTVTVNLRRKNMEEFFDKEDLHLLEESVDFETVKEDVEDEEDEEAEEKPEAQSPGNTNESASPQKEKPKVWEKQKKKKGGKSRKKPVKQPVIVKKVVSVPATETLSPGGVTKKTDEESIDSTPNGTVAKSKRPKKENHSTDDEVSGDESADSDVDSRKEDDDDDWKKFQEEAKKDNPLETKSKDTHLVHCPHFPSEKHEWWWLYVADRKAHVLITAPVQVCSLREHEEVQLKFSAPNKPGIFQYTVILRSDSYFDFDQFHNIKLDVKEAKKVESHPQWEEMSDEEGEEKDDGEGSETEGSSYGEDSEED